MDKQKTAQGLKTLLAISADRLRTKKYRRQKMTTIQKPWVSGPKELLNHGLQHLELNSDFDCRMAMISIDNAVELMIKTYLGLPKRITKIENLTRKRYEEITNSFPNLMDGLEEFASDKLTGIELGDIEWFHRLRNQLYHDGNGITVEKEKVETYAAIAKILFENLFGLKLEEPKKQSTVHNYVGEFINLWATLERKSYIPGDKNKPGILVFNKLVEDGELSPQNVLEVMEVREFRNKLVHGMVTPTEQELKDHIETLNKILEYFD